MLVKILIRCVLTECDKKKVNEKLQTAGGENVLICAKNVHLPWAAWHYFMNSKQEREQGI